MTELLRDWIIGITCAAMIVALLEALMPEGGAKKVGRLAGGLLLVAATVQPLLTLEPDSLDLSAGQFSLTAGAEADASQSGELLKSIIAEETEAYILDKAKELGIACAVQVSCRYDGETGLFCPSGAEVSGALTEGQREGLRQLIERDLAIPVTFQDDTKEAG